MRNTGNWLSRPWNEGKLKRINFLLYYLFCDFMLYALTPPFFGHGNPAIPVIAIAIFSLYINALINVQRLRDMGVKQAKLIGISLQVIFSSITYISAYHLNILIFFINFVASFIFFLVLLLFPSR
ncbi:hypothetical protein [Providencia rettgeri]|uniref:hypothetical protein n=1 Tax=Providencia rettgeri TaxID=587 RepID=UPI0034E09A63